MEGVGARLGRSSTRYGPATVFSGPVRKWKKRWVHVTPPSSSSNHNNTHSHHHNAISNGTAAANNSSSSNGNNGSHLLLYKWTPLSQSNGSSSPSPATNNNGNSNNDDNKNNANLSNGDAPDEPPRRKFKYIPVPSPPFCFVFLLACFDVSFGKSKGSLSEQVVPMMILKLCEDGLGLILVIFSWSQNVFLSQLVVRSITLLDSDKYTPGAFGDWELLDLCAHTYQNVEKGYGERQWGLKGKSPWQVDLLERQKKEAEEQEALEKFDDESKLNDTDPKAELVSKSDSAEEKPDINDIPMEENEDDNQVVRQDLNESTLDLSLGLVS
ncbi:hypothetical protein POTOM_039232 [Populus tomentosa]|uniref:Uncharacterized protein n=1 Tax=Populus tomentosa TaxID=118781 RepID=A0A8X8CBE6_POPTO|nr:hypothetical protein POTOM_039232 [Populus tomentosa]